MPAIRRIGLATGGGDAPGLNAVIRAATLAALRRGWEVVGLQDCFEGLFDPQGTRMLDGAAVRGITHIGGTILGTQSGGDPFLQRVVDAGGVERTVDRIGDAVAGFRTLRLDALIVIGGDGTMRLTHRLAEHGVPVVGVPKTIDNDLEGTVVAFGFDTAVSVATEAIDRLHSTADAHRRVMVVEVMGRYAGWIALHAGVGGTADVILLPEIPFHWERVFEKVRERERSGKRFSIVVVAEGALPVDGERVVQATATAGRVEKLGGIGELVTGRIAEATGKEARCVVLGHLQRGGQPTALDRLLSLRFGAAAVRTVEAGLFDVMVALDPPDVVTVPLAQVMGRMKRVPLDSDTVCTARDLGICLGD
ncbi:MAG TPA: ATP-dependent 6-phosphofructokinase [Thermoanaerobaculia bacterium]|nr:ATP-dependent 6-phosphofructokinase [Thermoanaerobaculia bacterium]